MSVNQNALIKDCLKSDPSMINTVNVDQGCRHLTNLAINCLPALAMENNVPRLLSVTTLPTRSNCRFKSLQRISNELCEPHISEATLHYSNWNENTLAPSKNTFLESGRCKSLKHKGSSYATSDLPNLPNNFQHSPLHPIHPIP